MAPSHRPQDREGKSSKKAAEGGYIQPHDESPDRFPYGSIFTLYIGPSRKAFPIHMQPLKSKSTVVAKHVNGKEERLTTLENRIKKEKSELILEFADPAVVETFVHALYTGRFEVMDADGEYRPLKRNKAFELYLFVDSMGVETIKKRLQGHFQLFLDSNPEISDLEQRRAAISQLASERSSDCLRPFLSMFTAHMDEKDLQDEGWENVKNPQQ